MTARRTLFHFLTRPRVGKSTDRGSVTVQMVILLPVVFLFMFMALQSALWFHARAVALGAAQEGARVASSEGSTGPAGASAAADFVSDAGGNGVLVGSGVSASRDGLAATVTVTGTAQTVIPGWAPAISQSARVPVERFTGAPLEGSNTEPQASGHPCGQRWI